MPLPPNTTLALHGVSKPGEPLYSKPKQAIIVRLTSETLDALDSVVSGQNTLEFDFTKDWGIHIGDGFYPMTRREDNTRHDLLLRASTINKPNAPLKFHSSVSGRVTVEQELRRDVTDRVRQRTREVAEQRSERHTIMLDAPPTLSGPPKKKAAASAVKKAVRPSDPPKGSTSQITPAASRQASSKPGSGVPLTARLVHFLASGEKSVEDIAKALGATRGDVDGILRKVAEPTPTSTKPKNGASTPWRLTNEGWMQVRPYEWPSLNENARLVMARAGRRACQALRLPESDPRWSHFAVRKPKAATEDRTAASSERGPQSHPPEERNALPPKGKKRETSAQVSNQEQVKKLPGSGFRAAASGADSRASGSNRPPAHAIASRSTNTSQSSTPVPPPVNPTRHAPATQRPVDIAPPALTLKRKRVNPSTSQPLPLRVKEEDSPDAVGSTPPRAGSKSRSRRKSPIYTSSSEDEAPPSVRVKVDHPRHSPSRPSAPGSTNAALATEARYNEVYLQYVGVYQKLASQVQTNQNLLDTISSTDEEETQCHDGVLIAKDELSRLAQHFQKLKAELQDMAKKADSDLY